MGIPGEFCRDGSNVAQFPREWTKMKSAGKLEERWNRNGTGNTTAENSSIFFLILMRWFLSCRQ